MLTRISKLLVLFGTSLLFLLIAFGNIIDPHPNQTFAQHVVSMDTVSEKSLVVQRAIAAPWAGQAAFIWIVTWETAVTVFCFLGLFRCIRALKSPGDQFQKAKSFALFGLGLAMLLWVGGFLAVGGEWFCMWLSPQWNGQNSAGRMALITGLALLIVERPEKNE
jgi:predicted small integral membrane protein